MSDKHLTIELIEMGPREFGGLRQRWSTGQSADGEIEFEVDAGLGLGSDALYVTVRRNGKTRRFVGHVCGGSFQQLVTEIADEMGVDGEANEG